MVNSAFGTDYDLVYIRKQPLNFVNVGAFGHKTSWPLNFGAGFNVLTLFNLAVKFDGMKPKCETHNFI